MTDNQQTQPDTTGLPQRPMSRAEVADWLGVSQRTLERWATDGGGPPFRRVGGRVRYSPLALWRWWQAQEEVEATSQYEPEFP